MSSCEHYLAKTAPIGSSLHYSLLWLTSEQKHHVTLLYALWFALREIPLTIKDPGVARMKLLWWQQELHTTKPSHPLTQHLQPFLASLPAQWRDNLIAANLLRVDYPQFTTTTQVNDYCRLGRGQLSQIIAQQLTNTPLEQALKTGEQLERIQLILDVSNHPTQSFGEQTNDINQHQPGTGHLAILFKLKQSLLKEIAKDDFPLLTHETHLTPLRKLWIAWRAMQAS